MKMSENLALIELTHKDMEGVNQLILDKAGDGAGSHVEMIPQIAGHLISSGGKRLRPMITLASARLFGYQGQAHIELAAAVEFMHTATLLHDDVVDESELRRSRPTARMIWGNQASVLVGDFLLGQAFKMMVDVGSLPALAVLSQAATIIAKGEVMQLAASRDMAIDEAHYLEILDAKTAALFAAAAEVGPIIAGAPAAMHVALATYGRCLGLAFQLVDDALDYGGNSEKLGKNTGDDFREGKITLPVILSYQRGTEKEREFWQNVVARQVNAQTQAHAQTGSETNSEADFEKALQLMQQHKSLEDTIVLARKFGEKARDALKGLEDNVYRQALSQVVDFCINRVN